MSTAADQTTITYPTPPELIGEPGAVAQPPEVDPYTREVMADRHRAGDTIDELADDCGCTPEQVRAAVAEPTDEECRPPRRRHRWERLHTSNAFGDGTVTIEHLRCRRCGIQARRVPTRTGGSLRLEVLPDGATEWTRKIGECPGYYDERIPDDSEPQLSGLQSEIEIRGELLDRVKVATGETWWHGAVDRVERDYSRAERDQSLPERDQSRAEPAPARRPLPAERPSVTHKFRIAGQKGYLTVGMYPDTGRPGEVFAVMAKQGSTIAGLLDAWCRACSMALQHGMPVEDLVEKFSHFRFEPAGFTETEGLRHADSIVDYIARWIGMRFCAPVAEAEPTQGEQP